MKPHIGHITANVDVDGVSITLPRLRVDITEEQARRLRDVLNTVLPEQIAPRRRTDHYLLSIAGDVDPELGGPYDTDRERVEAAADYRRAHGDEDGLYRLDLRHGNTVAPLVVDTFRGWELEMPKPAAANIKWVSSAWIEGRNATVHENADGQFELNAYETRNGSPTLAGKGKFPHRGRAERAGEIWTRHGEWDLSEAIRGCTLCRCTATGEAYGFPVCDYHADHSEDDPRCPDCVPVHTGDRVLDGDQWRTVNRLDLAENVAYFADGGCMDIDEAGEREKRLPSESLSCSRCGSDPAPHNGLCQSCHELLPSEDAS